MPPLTPKPEADLVSQLAPLVADPARGPEVHALLRAEVDVLIAVLERDEFGASIEYSDEELVRRVRAYEDSAARLAGAMALVGSWAPGATVRAAAALIADVAIARERGSGQTAWLDLFTYPASYLFYAIGIAAVAAQRGDSLGVLFAHEMPDQRGRWRPLVAELNNQSGMRHEVAQRLPEMARHHTPASDWLFTSVRPALGRVIPSDRVYERTFDRYEILVGLGSLLVTGQPDSTWVPTGRFTWRGRYDEESSQLLLAAPERDPTVLALAAAFGRSSDELAAMAEKYVDIVRRIRGQIF